MTADGFLNQRQRHPVAMTAAIAINLAAVTAVLLAKSGTIRLPDPPIKIIDVWPERVPDEVRPQPEREQKQTKPDIFVPDKKVATRPAEPGTEVSGTNVFPPHGTGGTEARAEPTPTPTPTAMPQPVTVAAEPLPNAMRDFQPPYPSQLLRTGVEGKAVVRVLIGTDGRVKQVAIISADDPLFGDATERQALRKWRFRPATRDGAAVESWKQMTVRFEIRS